MSCLLRTHGHVSSTRYTTKKVTNAYTNTNTGPIIRSFRSSKVKCNQFF